MGNILNIAILGASGYTGAELVRLLSNHPHVHIAALTGESQAGQPMAQVYPHLSHLELPDLVKIEQVEWDGIDVVFCCLPHATTQAVLKDLPERLIIIDLSADFRLRDPGSYAQWYGHAHQAEALQKQAVYGLTEHYRAQVQAARLIANPGCYPTCSLLPLLPLVKAGAIDPQDIVIDAVSGVTGAGRAAKQGNLYSEIADGFKAYGVGSHRHMPEIEQELGIAAGRALKVSFTPHLAPMNRGMLATIHVKLAGHYELLDLLRILADAYRNEAFVQVLNGGQLPATQNVRGTNRCDIAVMPDRRDGYAIILSAIDNLVKGASGQAVQNFNRRFGFDEATALPVTAAFP